MQGMRLEVWVIALEFSLWGLGFRLYVIGFRV